MPEWLILMLVFWAVFGLTGGRSCGRRRGQLGDRWARSGSARVRSGSARARPGHHGSRPLPRQAPPAPIETVERRLQREFVEGRLSMDEYEEALWRELRPGERTGG